MVPPEFAEALMRAVERDPTLVITIDIAEGWVSAPAAGLDAEFPLEDFTRRRLLEGLDDVGLTMRHVKAIAAYEARRPAWMPQLG